MSKQDFSDFSIPEPTPEELKAAHEHFMRTVPRGKTFRMTAEYIGDKCVATSFKEVKAVQRDELN